MTLKTYVIIGAIMLTATLLPPSSVFAPSRDLTEEERESGFYNEEGYELSQSRRPAINPDFTPDESCLFDAFQLKCIPGSEQECPDNFGNNADGTCFPLDENGDWVCPEGYYNVDDDETGQCYPNDEECPDTMIFEEATRVDNDYSDSCIEYKIDCDLNEDHPLCNGEERTDGIKVCDQPDHPGYKFCN